MQLLLLPTKSLYKLVMIQRLCANLLQNNAISHGPTTKLIKLCKKYGVLHEVEKYLNGDNQLDLNQWKKEMYKVIWNRENVKWTVLSSISSSLSHVMSMTKTRTAIVWWDIVQKMPNQCRKCRTITRLLLECHHLESCTQKYVSTSNICKHCHTGIENLTHLFFECPENVIRRSVLREDFIKMCPNGLKNSINAMTNVEKTSLILSGLRANYFEEWIPIYCNIIDFIIILYTD